jgi:hypothetical protein
MGSRPEKSTQLNQKNQLVELKTIKCMTIYDLI